MKVEAWISLLMLWRIIMHDDLSPRIYIGDKRELEKKALASISCAFAVQAATVFSPNER